MAPQHKETVLLTETTNIKQCTLIICINIYMFATARKTIICWKIKS